MEICSNNRNRNLYPNPFDFKINFMNKVNNKTINPIINSLSILNFYSFNTISGKILGGTTSEPIINYGPMKKDYLIGCDFELQITNSIKETAIIRKYDHLRQKCLLSSSLSSIHNNNTYYNYKIINKSTNNKIHIPFNNNNYKYIGMYLEHLNVNSNNLENRFRIITNYDSENNLLELENNFIINKNINNLYRIRKELPLAMGFGKFNNISGNNGIKYVNKKGVINIEIINKGSLYKIGDKCKCKNNSNESLEIEVTNVNEKGHIISIQIINPGDNWKVNDMFEILSGDSKAIGKVLEVNLCLCLYDKKKSNNIIGNIYNHDDQYLYITNHNEEYVEKTKFFNNVPVNYVYKNGNINTNQNIVYKINKYILSSEMKWIVVKNIDNIPKIGDSWEIHKISSDGFSNILTNNTKNFINECFQIRLIKLILPNIEYKNKGYVYQLPYVYVRIQKNKKNNNYLSNNPNAKDILFKASIDDCKGSDIKFIKLTGSNMTQNIYLSYNEELVVKILHYDGTILLSKKIDHIVPYITDDLLQMSLLFEIKKTN